MAPRTRNWKALEMPDFAGRRYHVTVSGEVEVNAGNQTPHLDDHRPQGFNPRILLLDLTIRTDGDFGTGQMSFKPVLYEKATNGRAFDETDILFEGGVIERITVEHPKTATAKPAAKGTKTSANKNTKKAAKKTVKKTAKKAAKKAAKKTAKKTAGKTKKANKTAKKKRL